MSRYTLITLAASMLLQGCSLTALRTESPLDLGSDPIGEARRLAQEERHGEAVTLLRSALAQGHDSDRCQTALVRAERQKKAHEQRLRDRLLLEHSGALIKKIAILEQLARSDPADSLIAKQLELARNESETSRKGLSECGWRQQDQAPLLAEECLSLALELERDEQDARLRQRLQLKNQATLQEQEEQQRLAREQVWKSRNQERLHEALELFENNYLLKAKQLLHLILQEDASNSEAIALLAELETRLDGYLGQLLVAGDRLYQENEIEGAIATWRAVLSLDPNNEQAGDKIARAQRVLGNLESLRKNQ